MEYWGGDPSAKALDNVLVIQRDSGLFFAEGIEAEARLDLLGIFNLDFCTEWRLSF